MLVDWLHTYICIYIIYVLYTHDCFNNYMGAEKELHKYYKKVSSMFFLTKFLFKPDKPKSWKLWIWAFPSLLLPLALVESANELTAHKNLVHRSHSKFYWMKNETPQIRAQRILGGRKLRESCSFYTLYNHRVAGHDSWERPI